jgi:hypothetical protein
MVKHKLTIKEDIEEKINLSQFLITINSNRVKDDKFKQHCLKFFNNIHLFIDTREGYIPDKQMLINIQPYFEIGKKFQKYHCHSLITIKHNSNILINGEKLQYAANKMGYYINNRVIRGTANLQRVIQYMQKNQK